MTTVSKVFNTIDIIIEKATRITATIAVAAFTIITFFQVIGRNFFKLPMIWSMDVSTLCFTWCVFMGATLAVKFRSHYNVSIFPESWKKVNTALDVFADILGGVLFFCLIYYGIKYTKMGAKRVSDSLGITMNYLYFVIPFSAFFMFYYNLRVLISDIIKFCRLCKSDSPVQTEERE